ncbi:MAG: dTDP-4-dehydrorhamnose 3,5-epimerase [Saprospiraceae bacterium]|nr:dTDP-4-dehydrorhamnose 3,5-epimerase [Saprospiraceae bacterium]MDW8482896.1 dTDP-4-dehydrorhamnose 3,5-epimerase [Saprospiraceae bacterium]
MEFRQRRLPGVWEIRLSPICDTRGFFMRTYDVQLFEEAGIHRPWVQENHSLSKRRGILRGLHFQFPPYAETKLVRCIRGAIFDVFVDLRPDSPTFGQWDSIELSEDAPCMLLIPRGFAHGFCTLTEKTEVLYKVDSPYQRDYEGGLLWSDPDLCISWPISEPFLSEKDQRNWTWQTFVLQHSYRFRGLYNK